MNGPALTPPLFSQGRPDEAFALFFDDGKRNYATLGSLVLDCRKLKSLISGVSKTSAFGNVVANYADVWDTSTGGLSRKKWKVQDKNRRKSKEDDGGKSNNHNQHDQQRKGWWGGWGTAVQETTATATTAATTNPKVTGASSQSSQEKKERDEKEKGNPQSAGTPLSANLKKLRG